MFSKYRNVILLMLFLANVVNYLDRAALSVAAPFVSKELGLNPAELGLIFSSFFVGYALFNFVGGYYSDVYGPRKVLSGSMVIWSTFVGLTAGAFNFVSLLIIRVLFGLGEGPISSATSKALYNWFPTKERASAIGIAFAGGPLGAAVAGPIVGIMALHWGWRVSFVALAIIGLVWALLWGKMSSDSPKENSKVSPEELAEIEEGQVSLATVTAEKTPLSYLLKQPAILLTAFAFWSYNYILYFFLSWFPTYLMTEKGLSIKEMSIATVIPWVVGTVGLVLGGYISGYIYKKTGKLMFARKVVIVSGLLATAVCIALTGVVDSAVMAVSLMTVAIFCMYITGPSYWAIIQDIVPQEKIGGVGGFVHFLSNTSGIIAPALTGFIVQFTGQFMGAFLLAGTLALLGSLVVGLFVKSINVKESTLIGANHS